MSSDDADGPNLDTINPSTSIDTLLDYAVRHVFLPVELPSYDDYSIENDVSLARAVCAAAHAYSAHVNGTPEPQWPRITKMLDNLQASAQSEHPDRGHVISLLRGMQTGDILMFLVRPRRAAIVVTKLENCMLLESFGVSPSDDAVEEAASLICSYPGSAVEMPNDVFDDGDFQSKLTNFFSCTNPVDSNLPLPSPDDPQYIAKLLTGILRVLGRTADILRITKHVRDTRTQGWRRSSLWLAIRVAIQMSFGRSPLGRASYKRFMLFFICTLAREGNHTNISSDLLQLMSCKILRRLSKIRSSSPDWLSEMALNTCTCLGDLLDARWKPSARAAPFQNPSQGELRRDTQLSLLDSREYISNALANPGHGPPSSPFHPSHCRRGALDNFLSSNGTFFEEAYDANPDVTLYDVEKSVEQGLDDWYACVTNVEEACTQLEFLMDQYIRRAKEQRGGTPEDHSIMFLTAIELFVALDKLVLKEIPMLADYSPEIPIALLEKLLLRKTTSLHRLSRVYQYLSARWSRSRSGWTVLSDKFTEESFPVRYFDQSPTLQQLKARIERDGMVAGPRGCGGKFPCIYDGYQEDQQQLSGRRLAEGTEVSKLPLPTSPLHAKVVVFELQCPACVRIWRSAAIRILQRSFRNYQPNPSREDLPPYLVERQVQPLSVQIGLAYFYPENSQSHWHKSPGLSYMILQGGHMLCEPSHDEEYLSKMLKFRNIGDYNLAEYVNSTSHTSNDVLAAQADCPADLSLDEFIAFGNLRSGGSLQWLNILRGLRSRSLNFHRPNVHYLLAQAAFQVGPLDLNTMQWLRHTELQDSSFCDTLLVELDSLFVDIGAGSIDSVMMNSISLLLTRLLASCPSQCISERAIALLRRVRRKTFKWVQELSYNVAMAPMNRERHDLLYDMAASCRSTFDVDPTTFRKLFHSAEDVDALLSCSSFIYTFYPNDLCLTPALEGILGDVILADPSDYGVDLAVSKIFPSYKPSARKWVQLQHPNAHWLTCETGDPRSQTVHLNLLNGALRLDGQPLNGLPNAIRDSPQCREIFRDQGFFVIPSDLPGMDFTTSTKISKHTVHFSLRGDDLMVRVQCSQTDEILELIPSRKLEKDLPPALVKGHVHWLNLSTKIIEIRPLDRLWEKSSENWRIDCASGQYQMYKGLKTLVDIRSPTWAMVSECVKCVNVMDVADPFENLLITVSPIDSSQHLSVLRLSVALPHFGLSFFVNGKGELESCDFKYMVYDENQCIGALFGLENLLVLRQKNRLPEHLMHRRVLILNGFPTRHDDHRVSASTQDHRWSRPNGPLYHTYDVDTELGCLIGDGSLTSTRHLAYLHAMTSSHRPDPLTGKTGTQAALCLLQSAGCRSIMQLKALDNDKHWTSTKYPQINISYQEIQSKYYSPPSSYDDYKISWGDKCATQRAAYLFPWHAQTGPTSTRVPTEPGLPTPPLPTSPPQCISNERTPWLITLDQLLSNRPAPELPARGTLPRDNHKTSSDDIPEFDQLVPSLLTNISDPAFQREYITRLNASAQCVREESRTTYRLKDRTDALKKHYVQCRLNYLDALRILKERLGSTSDPHEQALHRFGQWPPITADVLLRCLAFTSPVNLPGQWKKCLVSLAFLLLELQRARRLLRFALDDLEEEFLKELENEGCDGWRAEDYPEWLLIQIQGNFLIRRTQVGTALEMMFPKSGGNTVMQVNMGEGKSSVIVPIAASALADGKQLVRVVVPKALTLQMFELLVARLGGLANRPIYHLPISRSPGYGDPSSKVHNLHMIMSECMVKCGILLVQPEHVVSLKLKTVEEQIRERKPVADLLPKPQRSIHEYITTALLRKLSLMGNIFRSLSQSLNHSNKTRIARGNHHDKCSGDAHGAADNAFKWLSLQKWIESNSRDIMDESDEILHPRFQLIYTVGLQQHMDGYPDRWTITQNVLRLVKECADTLSRNRLNSMQYECDPPGSFPHIRIVGGPDVGRHLMSLIVEKVMAVRLPNFDFQHVRSQALHDAIRCFISDENVLQIPDIANRVEEYAKGSRQNNLWSGLLLLRGLLTSNILLFALTERRWRVDYGLVSRPHFRSDTMLAVPYRAKDVPAPNTQFGHPDITIILTCLSYYYTGLSEEQLRVSFEILLDQYDPSTEYALWLKEYGFKSVPDSLQKLGEINLKSSEQWDKEIFPLFTRNHAVVDFYLSRVVFPKEAKEFPWKISGSSWDLAEKRKKVITGFSGTNDSRWLLPMSIAQRDLDHQQGSNARVLAYLLQPENDYYTVTHENGERSTTVRFLHMVATQRPEIRVLLDVGAQILDFSNRQVAEAWLDIARDATGAVYFNENDELMVLTQSGITQSMRSSPLSQQLDRCVVYLDHAHTRGTDIKLPIGSRAAVTLGLKVTKDHLVQGCMRMRKLGHGHSVMFFAPLEVDWSIRAVVSKKDPTTPVATVDVLCWAIHETWADIQRRAPYWAQQGMSHKSRYDAWSNFVDTKLTRKELADAWLQPDIKSLADLYAPSEAEHASGSLSQLDPEIRQRCKDLGVLSLPNAQMEEEHEREVNREREREREVELPPWARPAEHYLHPDIIKFVKTGDIPPLHASSALHPVFTTLEKSSAATRDGDVWSPFILATADFCKTIDPDSTRGTMDQYLRPVQWILSRKNLKGRDRLLVLLSPFEADSLMPDIRASEYVHLHLYAPRTSLRLQPSDDLQLYSVPSLPPDWTLPWALIDQLNMFAGQLYLRDYQSYLRLCCFLDVPTKESPNDTAVRWNLFNIPGSLEENEVRFSGSPLPFVMALLAIRNRGQPFAQTHMGKILQGQQLTEKDFRQPTLVLSGHSPATCDGQTPHDFTSEAMLTLPSDVNWEAQEGPATSASLRSSERGWEMADVCDADSQEVPASSALLRSSKRGLETADISAANSEPPRKRVRAD